MTSRDRFLAACACRAVDRPPFWIMRQAGRYLPEYRELKAKHGFLKMVQTPELAVEVSLQPLRRFPIDAAILFSDILVVPEALGQRYRFRDEGGIEMERRIEDRAGIDLLGGADEIPGRLEYVAAAIRLLKAELGGKKALIGFGGSPWTLATYMVEGGSSENFSRIKGLFYGDRPAFDALLEKLTSALEAYFRMQVEAGAEAIQVFDSWGGAVAGADYGEASLRWIARLARSLPPAVPMILFARGTGGRAAAQAAAGARVLSLDWSVDLAAVRAQLGPPTALQGNLDPVLLNTSPTIVRRETSRLLESMRGSAGYIFNLGHGILPEARIECVEALSETVVGWK